MRDPLRAAPTHFPHADLWTVGTLFFLSRIDWIISMHYHGNISATDTTFTALAGSLVLVALAYAFARFASERVGALALRALVLAMWMFFVWVTFRRFFVSGGPLTDSARVALAVAGLAMTGLGAVFFARIWQRLRAALIAAALIGALSPFVLVALMAPRIELFAAPGPHPRPVVVLMLDEFSAGSAGGLVTALGNRQLRVESWSVPSIGENTLDAIPAMLSGAALLEARPCTLSAVCGRGRAVDLARIGVVRNDVDVFGFHHPYCAIAGLRSCEIINRVPGPSATIRFLCALPVRRFLYEQLTCGFGPSGAIPPKVLADAERSIDGAPFWTQGGILYAHMLLPHPPGVGGELKLADAYAANIERAEQFVLGLVEHLDRSSLRDEYTLVVTSDHPLRVAAWCKIPPFATHGCEVPASMRTHEVPFIVATRGKAPEHRVPRSNVDLLPIVDELSARQQ